MKNIMLSAMLMCAITASAVNENQDDCFNQPINFKLLNKEYKEIERNVAQDMKKIFKDTNTNYPGYEDKIEDAYNYFMRERIEKSSNAELLRIMFDGQN